MAKVITIGIQKGGSGKTTTTGIVAYLLSQKYKVLAVDMDSQGNLTEMMTGEQDIYRFKNRTILEAIKERDARNYIHRITDNLHIIPTTDLLSTFANYLYNLRGNKRNLNLILSDTLDTVKQDYDFIIIDTPPALGEQTIGSICASDYVIVMFETSMFCYSALPRFLETYAHCRIRVNQKLKLLGMIRTLIDNRRSDNKVLVARVEEEYKDLCFKHVITRTAAIGRISLMGFIENSELENAVTQYKQLVDEILERIKNESELEKFNEMIDRKLVEEWTDENEQ
jgi:chromosome partitioning protein